MNSSEKHPSRKQLIAAAQSGRIAFGGHLERCVECRDLFALYRRFDAAGSATLLSPSADIVRRWTAVPLLAESEKAVRRTSGRLTFDSWQERSTAVRDIPDGLVRRLCLKTRNVVLEIVGERRRKTWHFIARIYRDRDAVTGYALKAGRQQVLPGEDGFFAWSSNRPPQHVALLSPDEQVHFEALSW